MEWSARRLGIVFPFMAVMLMLTLAACGGSATAPDDAIGLVPNVITGVLSDASGAPLAGRQVSVSAMTVAASAVQSVATGRALNNGAARSSVASTDARGVFSVPVSHAGTYGLASVSDSDGAYVSVAVHVDTDGVLMQAGEVRMASTPLGAISGQVDGPGAGVFVFALGTSFSAVTDASGAFAMTRVPAGSYQVVAGFPGSITAPVEVTVVSGATTALSSTIEFGPRVDGVDPSGFVPWVMDESGWPVSPPSFTISGSGFGSSQALSDLRYAGTNVDTAIRSWTDTEIVVDVERIDHSLAAGSRLAYETPAEAFVFEVVTATGSAFTAPVGVITEIISSGWDSTPDGAPASDTLFRVQAYAFWVHQLPDVTYDLDVENGQALDADDLSPINSFMTAPEGPRWGNNMHLFIRQTSGLPAIITFDPRGTPHFGAVEPTSLVVARDIEFGLDNVSYAAGSIDLSGTVLSWDGLPMPDDGNFSLTLSVYGEEPVSHPIAIDGDGRFDATVAITIPDSSFGLGVNVSLVYQGAGVAGTSHWSSGSFELDSDVYGWGSVDLSGTVLGWDGLPMPDDGEFSLNLATNCGWGRYWEYLGSHPIAIDGSGRFNTTATIPEDFAYCDVDAALMHQSDELARTSFYSATANLSLDGYTYSWGSFDLSGTVLAMDYQPMPDDGNFSLRLTFDGEKLGAYPITLDADGRFLTTVTIPEAFMNSDINVYLTNQMMYVAVTYLYVLLEGSE